MDSHLVGEIIKINGNVAPSHHPLTPLLHPRRQRGWQVKHFHWPVGLPVGVACRGEGDTRGGGGGEEQSLTVYTGSRSRKSSFVQNSCVLLKKKTWSKCLYSVFSATDASTCCHPCVISAGAAVILYCSMELPPQQFDSQFSLYITFSFYSVIDNFPALPTFFVEGKWRKTVLFFCGGENYEWRRKEKKKRGKERERENDGWRHGMG